MEGGVGGAWFFGSQAVWAGVDGSGRLEVPAGEEGQRGQVVGVRVVRRLHGEGRGEAVAVAGRGGEKGGEWVSQSSQSVWSLDG